MIKQEKNTLVTIGWHIVNKYPDSHFSHRNMMIKGTSDSYYSEMLVDWLMDYFIYERLELCGCGTPEYTYEVLRRLLGLRAKWEKNEITPPEVKEKELRDLGIDKSTGVGNGILQFLLYVLDSKGLLNHGSSIHGAWLTGEGYMFLDVLNEWYGINREDIDKMMGDGHKEN